MCKDLDGLKKGHYLCVLLEFKFEFPLQFEYQGFGKIRTDTQKKDRKTVCWQTYSDAINHSESEHLKLKNDKCRLDAAKAQVMKMTGKRRGITR